MITTPTRGRAVAVADMDAYIASLARSGVSHYVRPFRTNPLYYWWCAWTELLKPGWEAATPAHAYHGWTLTPSTQEAVSAIRSNNIHVWIPGRYLLWCQFLNCGRMITVDREGHRVT